MYDVILVKEIIGGVSVVSIIAFIVIALIVGIVTLQFVNFKDWLVWAVAQAEKKYGGKTGELKLHYAYDLATSKFPIITKFITFSAFKKLVDKALVKMKDILDNNKTIADIINKADQIVKIDLVDKAEDAIVDAIVKPKEIEKK